MSSKSGNKPNAQPLLAGENSSPVAVAAWQPVRDIPAAPPFLRYDLVRLKPEFVTEEKLHEPLPGIVPDANMHIRSPEVFEVMRCCEHDGGWEVRIALPGGQLGVIDDYRKLVVVPRPA